MGLETMQAVLKAIGGPAMVLRVVELMAGESGVPAPVSAALPSAAK
jgi:hypothetical protein